MVDILHRVGVTSSRDSVYQALTTPEGLAAWWTSDTRGDGEAGEWATFLMSLKSYLEEGKGAPAPYDVQISDWH